jgi:hypothetical protein
MATKDRYQQSKVPIKDKGGTMAIRVSHQDTVKAVLDSKAVDFAAVGKVVAQVGPSLSLADEPWETFCGTMRLFLRIFILNPPIGFPPQWNSIADLAQLREIAGELRKG